MYREISLGNLQRLSFGCDVDIHRRNSWEQSITDKVLFAGTFTPRRYRIIRRLIKSGIRIDLVGKYWKHFFPGNTISDGVYGNELSSLIQKYKLSLNMHNNENFGPNMRTFEVTGSGGTLLSDSAEDLPRFFKEDKEVFLYQDFNELAKLISELLSYDDGIVEVAKNAYERTHKSYTYDEVMKGFVKSMTS